MAQRPIPSLVADFSGVLSHLSATGVCPPNPSQRVLALARRIHECTYSLILWRFRLQGIPAHGRPFIEEIASDALQILPQIMMGYGKTAKLLTRGILENVLRHIYFSDHPVEFEKMNRASKWYLPIEELAKYTREHPSFLEAESKFDAINRLTSLYSELSAGIHGRQVRDLEMRAALQKIAYDHDSATKELELVQRCTEAANFLLAVYNRAKMAAFQTEDQRIILRTLPRKARGVWLALS